MSLWAASCRVYIYANVRQICIMRTSSEICTPFFAKCYWGDHTEVSETDEWMEHVVRMGEMVNACRILLGTPVGEKTI